MEERKDLLNGLEIQSYGNLIEPSQEAETMEDAATEKQAKIQNRFPTIGRAPRWRRRRRPAQRWT